MGPGCYWHLRRNVRDTVIVLQGTKVMNADWNKLRSGIFIIVTKVSGSHRRHEHSLRGQSKV